jgi:hypothetical protein
MDILFLDIDGVLHAQGRKPDGSRITPHFSCKPRFEEWARGYPQLQLVISSTWRQIYPLPALRGKFSPDIAARVIDVTPRFVDEKPYMRQREILAWLAKHRTPETPWLALDDTVSEFYPGCPQLVACRPEIGFDDTVAAELDRRMAQARPAA